MTPDNVITMEQLERMHDTAARVRSLNVLVATVIENGGVAALEDDISAVLAVAGDLLNSLVGELSGVTAAAQGESS